MALIKCTECGKELSDRASACPNCGCPTEIILEEIKELAEKERIEEEKWLEMERLQKEEEERKKQEEIEAEAKRKKEEEERREQEEKQLKEAYEAHEENNQQIVMYFPLFASDLTITRGMRDKINFYRESNSNKKAFIKQFDKTIQKIQNLNDVFGLGMTKFNDSIEGYVDKLCDLLKSFDDIDIEVFTNILVNESDAIVERNVETELGELMEDFRRMQGPSQEDTELWTREKFRVFNKYPIRDMLLKCLKDILNEIQQFMVKELAKQGVFVNWQPKQLESVRSEYKEYLQRYKNANCSLSELREKIVGVLSVDTYNQQHYQDILNLDLIGGEKANFIKICDFLGFNEIYRNYKFLHEETYIKELEYARDYLYGRGVPADIDKAKEVLEKNKDRFQDDNNYLEELSVAYRKSGDGNYKLVLLERCKLGDIQAATKIFSEVLEKEEVFEQVNLYSQVKNCFQTSDFSATYNKIFNCVKNDVDDVAKKIECFRRLGDPINSKDLYYLAKLFEKGESEKLWRTAARYYLMAANGNHLNSSFKVFAIVENGLLDIQHDRASIVMKQLLQNDHKKIIGFIKQLSEKGNLYAKYLYGTYVCNNYVMKNYKMPYIFVDNPEADVELFFSEYYAILAQAEEWLQKGADKAIEKILHMTKVDIVVTVAKYFCKGPGGTVMSDSARSKLDRKYSTISDRTSMASKIQDKCRCDGDVSPILTGFMEGFSRRSRFDSKYYCDLFEIYCGEIGGTLKYYMVSPDRDFILDTSVFEFLNEIKDNWEEITYGKRIPTEKLVSMEEEAFMKYLEDINKEGDNDSKYENRAAKRIYSKYRWQVNLNGSCFSYKIYGKQTMGVIVRKHKMVIEVQNDQFLDEPVTLNYVGNCVFSKKKEQGYFFVDTASKEYNTLDKLLNIKCCNRIEETSAQKKMICPYCNTILDLDMDFCFECGKRQDNKKEVVFVDAENFELLRQTLVNKEYDRLKKMVGDNANICVQNDDGTRDWLLNKVIEYLKDEKTVGYLLERGADCNSIRDIETKEGLCKHSALVDAIEKSKNLPLIKLLVSKGADIYCHKLVDNTVSADVPLLNLAIIKTKNYDIVKYLWDLYDDEHKHNSIRYVYNKNQREKCAAYSLLFDAIEFSENKDIVKLLLENGYSANEIRYSTPNCEIPALNAAIIYGDSSIVEVLLKYGANPHSYKIMHEACGDLKYSALADAMISNDSWKIDLMLNAGGSLDEWVFYKNKMIKLQNFPLKRSKLRAWTIDNLKRHGWQPPLFPF